ncbi:MAG TPA: hypothetical protein VHT51_15470 [Micropepsaceae bacterium]|jgi:hypothetical protein|nr:hypothetical protein [Micropepsaceae bacterium]
MRHIRNTIFAGIAFAALVPVSSGVQAQAEDGLPLDAPQQVKGVDTVCTGVGLEARQDPRWAAYSLKIEIAGKGGQYLGDVHVTVAKDSADVLALDCGGPWVLFKLPAGRYQVTAMTEGTSATSAAYVPATGQGRIILRFPELGGELEKTPDDNANIASNQ